MVTSKRIGKHLYRHSNSSRHYCCYYYDEGLSHTRKQQEVRPVVTLASHCSSKRIIYLECPLLGLRLVFRREFKMNRKVPSPACRSSPVPGAQTLNHTGRPYICPLKEESIETQYLKAAPNLSFLLTAYQMLENSSQPFSRQ